MRKYILILLLFLSSFAQAQFGWSGLSANQWVSFLDSQGSGIRQLQPVPTNAYWMDKQSLMYYFDVDTSSLVSLVKNQWVTKSGISGRSYPGTGTLSWAYFALTGLVGDYGEIVVNGIQIVYQEDSQDGLSFTLNDGDVVTITVRAANSGYQGDGTSIYVAWGDATSFEQHRESSGGYTTSSTWTFTWHPYMRDVTVGMDIVVAGTIYYNGLTYMSKYKNNCGAGYAGSNVYYYVYPYTYNSIISQDDVNRKAYNDCILNSQTYANANGTCIASTDSIRWSFNTNIGVGSTVLFTIKKNGTTVVSKTDYGNGAFIASTGDVIEVRINTTYTGSTSMTELLEIMGNGLYLIATTGTIGNNGDILLIKTFIYNSTQGDVNIIANKTET